MRKMHGGRGGARRAKEAPIARRRPSDFTEVSSRLSLTVAGKHRQKWTIIARRKTFEHLQRSARDSATIICDFQHPQLRHHHYHHQQRASCVHLSLKYVFAALEATSTGQTGSGADVLPHHSLGTSGPLGHRYEQ